MRKFAILFALTFVTMATACTEKERARSFGGTTTTEVAACQKLVLVTWKEDDLWVLTRPAKQGDTSETYTFNEDSSYGLMEGTVVVKENITPGCFASMP